MKKVCIIGSGNWGCAIARIVGNNVSNFKEFHNTVKMYVFEEIINERKLSEIINTQHENVKYLPGFEIPSNVIAIPDLLEAASDADILIWVLPHKFVENTCAPLVGKVKSTAVAVSLVKGFNILPRGGITLISEMLRNMLKIEVCVLMGANLAREVAAGEFCESTLGCKDLHVGKLLKKLFQTDNFRISVVDDISSIEVCGALKNIVAVGAGLVDGLKYGGNTKAAVMRIGFSEMIRYAKHFYPESKIETFLESCGIADLITSCYGGRNRQIGEAFVETGKSMEELEKEMLQGQRMQGPQTAEEVMLMLKKKGEIKKFPFLVTVHHICTGELKPPQIIDCIRSYPEHLS